MELELYTMFMEESLRATEMSMPAKIDLHSDNGVSHGTPKWVPTFMRQAKGQYNFTGAECQEALHAGYWTYSRDLADHHGSRPDRVK